LRDVFARWFELTHFRSQYNFDYISGLSNKMTIAGLRKNAAALVVALVVMVTVTVILWPFLFESVIGRHESQRQVRHLVETLSLGSASDTVEAVIGRPEYDRLTLAKADDLKWLVETPPIPGARNWVLWLAFDRGRLSRVAVRTADSSTEMPAGAPADKAVVR
jgi:hypothetical protein